MEKTWYEDYIENKDKKEVIIIYSIRLPVLVDNFNIDVQSLKIRQEGQKIIINYRKKIPLKLFEDLRDYYNGGSPANVPEVLLKRNPSQYIVAYIKENLSRINDEIVSRRYKEGHLILKTVSLFDIEEVFIFDLENNYYPILWPIPLPKYPLTVEYYKNNDSIFVRDLINAMTEYFYYDLDECVRKIITSLENYFKFYNLKIKKDIDYPSNIENSKFKKLIYCYIQEDYYKYKERDLCILRENIAFVYDTRCDIVHDKLRLRGDNLVFCHKAIKTLSYIYQSVFIDNDSKHNYIFSLYSHFDIITNVIVGLNLDQLEKAASLPSIATVKNSDDMNKNIFSSLKITEKINGFD